MTPSGNVQVEALASATAHDVSGASSIAIYTTASDVSKLEVSADGSVFSDLPGFTTANEVHIIPVDYPVRFIRATFTTKADVAFRTYTR